MKKLIAAIAFITLLTGVASADVVVNLPLENVTASQNLTGGKDGYSSTDISPSSGYTGPTFFGGAQIHDNTAGGVAGYRVAERSFDGGDFISTGAANGTVGTTNSVGIVWVFVFDASSSFSMGDVTNVTYNYRSSGGGADRFGRLVAQSGSSLYISSLIDVLGDSLDESEFDLLSWFEYAPTGTDLLTIGNSASVSGLTMNAMGMWVDAVDNAGDGDISYVGGGLREFIVETVPEPATVGMLGIGALVALLIRRIQA